MLASGSTDVSGCESAARVTASAWEHESESGACRTETVAGQGRGSLAGLQQELARTTIISHEDDAVLAVAVQAPLAILCAMSGEPPKCKPQLVTLLKTLLWLVPQYLSDKLQIL
ncbi:hypothetical protein AAY473_022371 [Plecturocebus cupreus]